MKKVLRNLLVYILVLTFALSGVSPALAAYEDNGEGAASSAGDTYSSERNMGSGDDEGDGGDDIETDGGDGNREIDDDSANNDTNDLEDDTIGDIESDLSEDDEFEGFEASGLEITSIGTPISTAAELAELSNSSGQYYLTSDITIPGNWVPIDRFRGTLDGAGHTITFSSRDNRHGATAGLFGGITSGTVTIRNLNLNASAINAQAPNSGNSRAYAGGLIGIVIGGNVTIENVSFRGNVQARSMYDRTISGFYENPLAGYLSLGLALIPGWFQVFHLAYELGGIGRDILDGMLSENGSRSHAGGLIGYVTGQANVRIVNSYARGDVQASAGLSLADATSFVGAARARGHAGGLVGSRGSVAQLEIVNCYVTNNISAHAAPPLYVAPDSNAGSLVGHGGTTAAMSANYRLNTQSLTVNRGTFPVFPTGNTNNNGTSPLTEAQMRNQSSFIGWDFLSTWAIDSGQNNGFPTLRVVQGFIPGFMGPSMSITGGFYYEKFSSTPIEITISMPSAPISGIQVNDVTLSETAHFTINGSSQVSILPVFLDALEEGFHSLRVNFTDGSTSDSQLLIVEPLRNFLAPIDTQVPWNRIIISTPEQLAAIGGAGSAGRYYVLGNDINLTGRWEPIDDFRGTFDGQGFIINNLWMLESDGITNAGLFGLITTGDVVIKNLGVGIGAWDITGTYAGGLVAQNNGNLKISNCYVINGGISGIRAGGLVARSNGRLTVEDSYAANINISALNTATGGSVAGGLIAECADNESVRIENCHVINGSITASGYSPPSVGGTGGGAITAGGIAGRITGGGRSSTVSLNNCSSTGTVFASNSALQGSVFVGGLVGGIGAGGGFLIENSNSASAVSATTSGSIGRVMVGGLIGSTGGSSSADNIIRHCFATGEVSANGTEWAPFIYKGGFIGTVGSNIRIENSHSTGHVISTSLGSLTAGGFIGDVNGFSVLIADCYTSGNVSAVSTNGRGDSIAGGFIGEINGGVIVRGCNSTGSVNSTSTTQAGGASGTSGGFIGMIRNNNNEGTISIESSRASGTAASNRNAGGFIGYTIGSVVVQQCSAFGNVSAPYRAGGLIGVLNSSWNTDQQVRIEQSFASGNVTIPSPSFSTSSAGGLIGFIELRTSGSLTSTINILNSYATGNINAPNAGFAGGLTGDIDGTDGWVTLTNCYAIGNVSASLTNGRAGALLGNNSNRVSVYFCYYLHSNIQTVTGSSIDTRGSVLVPEDMLVSSTFNNWDFNSIWGFRSGVNSGRPVLRFFHNDMWVSVTGVTLDKTTISLEVGNSDVLTANVTPASATNRGVVWSSSNPSVAFVYEGRVTAVSAGTAVIRVTTVDRSRTATCTVTVAPKSVSVGTQDRIMTAGNSGIVAFPVTTTSIVNGTYTATVTNLPTGVSVLGQVTINNKSGTLILSGNITTLVGTTNNLRLTIDGTQSGVFSLTISPPKSVMVGTQVGILAEGTSGTVTFPVTTTSIANGSYTATVTGLPTGVTVQGQVVIDNNRGILTLAGNTTTLTGVTGTHRLTIDGTQSANFSLTVSPPKAVMVGTQNGALAARSAGTVTFPVTTTSIANGSYTATVTNRPPGVTVQGQVVINNNSGILTLAGNATTVTGVTDNLTLTIDGIQSGSFSLTILPPKEVTVGTQSGTISAGSAGTVTFPITTTSIANGSYTATVMNLPTGVTVQGQVVINNNSGTLTLAGNTTTIFGTTNTLRLTIDGTLSGIFSMTILPPKTVAVGAQRGTLIAGISGTVTFPVTTANIENGNYTATVTNLPTGVTAQGQVVINNNSGILTLAGSTTTFPAATNTLRLTIDGAQSGNFTLVVTAPPVLIDTELSLRNAVLASGSQNIALGADIGVLTEQLTIERNLILDLNGHTLTIEIPHVTGAPPSNGISLSWGVILTIIDSKGGGALNVTNNSEQWLTGYGAAINTTEGVLIINSGIVNASAGSGGAGIGGGVNHAGGHVTINGGVVTAGGSRGAGIGGGANGAGGTIIINGGKVIADNNNSFAAGIGGGESGAGGTITINGGTIIAATAFNNTNVGGNNSAAIGRGGNGASGTLNIHGTYDYWADSEFPMVPASKTGTESFNGAVTNISINNIPTAINTVKYIRFVAQPVSLDVYNIYNFNQLRDAINDFNSGGMNDATINIRASFNIEASLIITNPGSTLTIRSAGATHTLTRSLTETLFIVENHANLVFENIIIDGNKDVFTSNTFSLVIVRRFSSLTMNSGAVLRNNRATSGGAVRNDGTFVINDGEIRDNIAVSQGGAVINGPWALGIPLFTINGGKISGNSASSGGGIYINVGRTFFNGGEITGNSAVEGNGIHWDWWGTLEVSGTVIIGTTTDNNAISRRGAHQVIQIGRDGLSGNASINVDGVISIGSIIATKQGGGVVSDVEARVFRYPGVSFTADGANVVVSMPPLLVTTFAELQAAINTFNTMGNADTTILIGADIEITSSLTVSNQNNHTLTIKSEGATRTLTRNFSNFAWPLFSAADIVLEDIIIDGNSAAFPYNQSPLITVGGGVLTINSGVVIRNNVNTGSDGAGIQLGRGTLILNGGEISGNQGSGIRVHGGTILMNDGVIKNNRTGVSLVYNSAFTMNGGSIKDNMGVGVVVSPITSVTCTFTMNGGLISGNTGSTGGGVHTSGTFIMNGGEISDNIATSSGGGGVTVSGGSLILGGTAVIRNNTRSGGISNNVNLSHSHFITLGTGTGNNGAAIPASGMDVRVTTSMANEGVFVNSGAFESHIGYFHADDSSFEVVHNNGQLLLRLKPIITINTHPAPITNTSQGSISSSLNIAASVTQDVLMSYQWFTNTENSNAGGTAIGGATGASFSIPTNLTAGTYFYFAEVSAMGATPVRSNVARVNVSAPPPVITIDTHPASVTEVVQGNVSGSLTVAASVTQGVTMSYQWFSNTFSSNAGGTIISGATGASITIPASLTAGTYFYYVEVRAEGAASVRSDVARVNVSPPPREPTPNATIDFTTEQLTGLVAGGRYSFNNGIAVVVHGTTHDIPAGWMGHSLSIVRLGNGTTTIDSAAQSLFIPSRPTAAPSVTAIQPTAIGGTGGIGGTTTAMEYWRGTTGNWSQCMDQNTSGLQPGTYEVRFRATATEFAGMSASVTIVNVTTAAQLIIILRDNIALGDPYAVNNTVAIIRGLNTTDVAAAKAADPAVVKFLEELEIKHKENNDITIRKFINNEKADVLGFDHNRVSAVGIGKNATSKSVVTLSILPSQANITIPSRYSNVRPAIPFIMTLSGGDINPGQLSVPVTITIPVPNGFNPERFRILHFHAGNANNYDLINPDISSDGTYATFTLTRFSEFAFVEIMAATPPSTPLNFGAIPGDTRVSLTWIPPVSDGGVSITGYQVSRDNGSSWVAASSSSGHTFTGLTNGVAYTFRVRAVNSVGAGVESSVTATPLAPIVVPSVPQNFRATPGSTLVSLEWAAPARDGGATITGYQVSSDNGVSWVAATSSTWHLFTGLTNGVAYTFRVRAINAAGNGEVAVLTATPAAAAIAPSAPQNFTATQGDRRIILNWTAPANNGGAPITSYDVSMDGGTTWVRASTGAGHTFTGLANGVTYVFLVRAVNSVGASSAASLSVRMLDAIEQFVARLYMEVLGRPHDEGGLRDWSDLIRSRQLTGANAAYEFFFSPEFMLRPLTDTQYVDILYRTLLNRNADTAGRTGWVETLALGWSREDIFSDFVHSVEFDILCRNAGIERGTYTPPQDRLTRSFVTRLYRTILGRPPDTTGLTDWTNALLRGEVTGAAAAHLFVFSPEFALRNVSDEQFIRILYISMLGRGADPAGLAGWIGVLRSGATRYEVFVLFVNSVEFDNICTSYGIVRGTAPPQSR